MKFHHKPVAAFRIFSILILLLIAGFIITSNSTKSYADDENEPEKITEQMKELDVITIENKGYNMDRKGPSIFEHTKHARDYKLSCWECHHVYEEDVKDKEGKMINLWSPWKENQKQKCSECHDPMEEKDGKIMLQAAYHKNCKVCHEDKRIYGDNNLEYRKCTECHKHDDPADDPQ